MNQDWPQWLHYGRLKKTTTVTLASTSHLQVVILCVSAMAKSVVTTFPRENEINQITIPAGENVLSDPQFSFSSPLRTEFFRGFQDDQSDEAGRA